VDLWEIVAVARISSALFVNVWEKRRICHCGSRLLCAIGVKDRIDYATKY
jgi:hypothetical protein